MKNRSIAKWLGRLSLLILFLFLTFLLSSWLRTISNEPSFTLSSGFPPILADLLSSPTERTEPTALARATADPQETAHPFATSDPTATLDPNRKMTFLPLLLIPFKEPTPTLDPTLWVLPTIEIVVTSTAGIATTPKPWPTETPLPTLAADSPDLFSVQNIEFGRSTRLRERLPTESTGASFPTWSPDGKLFAFTQPTGTVLRGKRKLESGTVVDVFWPETEIIVADAQRQKQRSLGRGTELSWSASGEHIAYLNSSDDLEEYHIKIINVTTDQTFSVATLKGGKEYSTLAWLSETELLYYQETVMLFDYTTGQKTRLLERVKTDIPLDISSRFKYLATIPSRGLMVAGSGAEILILERRGPDIHLIKRLEDQYSKVLAISPDGNFFAYAAPPWGQAKIVSIYTDETVIELPEPSRGSVKSMTWAPDSASLMYMDSEGVHIVNRDGSGLQLIEGLPGGSGRLAWSPQGTSLLITPFDGEFSSLSISTKRTR